EGGGVGVGDVVADDLEATGIGGEAGEAGVQGGGGGHGSVLGMADVGRAMSDVDQPATAERSLRRLGLARAPERGSGRMPGDGGDAASGAAGSGGTPRTASMPVSTPPAERSAVPVIWRVVTSSLTALPSMSTR